MSTGAPDLCTHELYPLEGQPTQPVHWSPAPSLPSPPPPPPQGAAGSCQDFPGAHLLEGLCFGGSIWLLHL